MLHNIKINLEIRKIGLYFALRLLNLLILESMKKFFLFGSEACDLLDDGEKALLKAVKNEPVVYGLFEADENTTFESLLDAYDGWQGWAVITESLYKKLQK